MPPRRGLRVGLTGGLGSGKTTVARMLASRGAYVLSADDLARELMEPGTAVFAAIVRRFGDGVVGPDQRLDRAVLSRLAFGEGRVEELNAIVHPATIALQGERTAAILDTTPDAIVVVESALIFETNFGHGWRQRFDKMILVTAPDALKIERFVSRAEGLPNDAPGRESLQAEATRRLARMLPDDRKIAQCDFIIPNHGSLEALEVEVSRVWSALQAAR